MKGNHFLRNTIDKKGCESYFKNLNNIEIKYCKASHWASDTGYGLMDVYKDFAGFDNKYVPKVNALHGTFMGMKDIWWENSEAGIKSLPAMFVYYDSLKNKLNNLFRNKKLFISIEHPYHIILRNYSEDIIQEKSGSVLFLPHSVGYGELFSVHTLLNYLNSLESKYKPIKICVHPADLKSSNIKILQENNFQIVCCGNRYDPLFLHRFFWICNGPKYCLSIDLSTHTILSSISGLEIISLYNQIPIINWIHGNQIIMFDKPDFEYWYIIESFFSGQINQSKFRDKANYVTGKNLLISKIELRKILEECEKKYNNVYISFLTPKIWNYIEPFLKKIKTYKKAIQNRLSGNNKMIQPISANIFYQLFLYFKSFED